MAQARSPSARRMTSPSPRALGDGRRRAPYRNNGKKMLMPGDGNGAYTSPESDSHVGASTTSDVDLVTGTTPAVASPAAGPPVPRVSPRKIAAIRKRAGCDTPTLLGSGRWSGRGPRRRWGNRRIRNPCPLVSGDDTVATEHVSPVRILDDSWLRGCRPGIGLVTVDRRRRVGRRGRVVDGWRWVVDGGWRDDDPGNGMGQDFSHDDQRCEDRERGQTDHAPAWPVASGVSCGRPASDEKDGNEQNSEDSTHGHPPFGSRTGTTSA